MATEIKKPTVKKDDGLIECTVTKKGDGKISTGVHVAGVGDVKRKRGDKFKTTADIADALADLGFIA